MKLKYLLPLPIVNTLFWAKNSERFYHCKSHTKRIKQWFIWYVHFETYSWSILGIKKSLFLIKQSDDISTFFFVIFYND